MKRGLIAAGAVAMLLLTGCTAGGEAEPAASSSPTVASPSAQAAAPLVAEAPSASPSEASTPEAAFLAQVREVLPADTVIPNATDEQLLAAGASACDQMAQGTDFSQVSVIEGEQMNELEVYPESGLIAAVARKTICG
ncbi:DUF732 domain-containing protein [Microbacterium enclense]|uniref:DUF732 domain-containing protein n=1 Tax=Microbacterium enclense TaxID=993073 RepID=UPI0021A51CA1|nr:DUF732 domain-containing protein [Microbacterium enclense]MCT2085033.1 DUF732 domain-containing protein [Microbacterium enclense]